MGNKCEGPNTEKIIQEGEIPKLIYVSVGMQGWRDKMVRKVKLFVRKTHVSAYLPSIVTHLYSEYSMVMEARLYRISFLRTSRTFSRNA